MLVEHPKAKRPETGSPSNNECLLEEKAWLDLPFVEVIEDQIVSHWSTPSVPDYFDARSNGVAYANMFIEHLRRFHDPDTNDITWRLSDVVRDFGKMPSWTGTELAFLQSVASYLALGRIEEAESDGPSH